MTEWAVDAIIENSNICNMAYHHPQPYSQWEKGARPSPNRRGIDGEGVLRQPAVNVINYGMLNNYQHTNPL
jgi:hypothetical protein